MYKEQQKDSQGVADSSMVQRQWSAHCERRRFSPFKTEQKGFQGLYEVFPFLNSSSVLLYFSSALQIRQKYTCQLSQLAHTILEALLLLRAM